VYLAADGIGPVLGGLGVSILTTSHGVMTGRAAKKAGIGGEVLCNVW
jgi:small subunit ribosomal protein S8